MLLHRLRPILVALIVAVAQLGSARAAGADGVVLEWTVPGDNGYTGRAFLYDLRYSNQPITAANFDSASRSQLPAPGLPGTLDRFTVSDLPPGQTWYFAIKTMDRRGNWSNISNVIAEQTGTVGVDDGAHRLNFSVPSPNPALRLTRFTLTLPREMQVRVEALDLSGRRVRTIASGLRPTGTTDLSWDLRDDLGRTLGAGVYWLRARVGERTITRRVVMLR